MFGRVARAGCCLYRCGICGGNAKGQIAVLTVLRNIERASTEMFDAANRDNDCCSCCVTPVLNEAETMLLFRVRRSPPKSAPQPVN